jgi:hypothetical protein
MAAVSAIASPPSAVPGNPDTHVVCCTRGVTSETVNWTLKGSGFSLYHKHFRARTALYWSANREPPGSGMTRHVVLHTVRSAIHVMGLMFKGRAGEVHREASELSGTD